MQILRLLLPVHGFQSFLDADIERYTHVVLFFKYKTWILLFVSMPTCRCGPNYFRTRIRTKTNYPSCKISMIFSNIMQASSGSYYGYGKQNTAHLIKDPKHRTGTVS
ncbi:hypothetical protein SORBI_3006G227500 [Sorghum bicolor]|uniref:Uncharacterized protein n=1 Tax=Sorghum bicolor TaxID=4558 RepID=A0A1B6PNE2_SORBI|nr:hypothetical protein SORBI_3006G227500 [Sorghum bicolor]